MVSLQEKMVMLGVNNILMDRANKIVNKENTTMLLLGVINMFTLEVINMFTLEVINMFTLGSSI